jgi:hypothetical protein
LSNGPSSDDRDFGFKVSSFLFQQLWLDFSNLDGDCPLSSIAKVSFKVKNDNTTSVNRYYAIILFNSLVHTARSDSYESFPSVGICASKPFLRYPTDSRYALHRGEFSTFDENIPKFITQNLPLR